MILLFVYEFVQWLDTGRAGTLIKQDMPLNTAKMKTLELFYFPVFVYLVLLYYTESDGLLEELTCESASK